MPNTQHPTPNSQEGIVCFGEIMLRLTPTVAFERLEQCHQLNMSFAGAESNIATSLARFGHPSWFVTRLPENPFGSRAINLLREHGIRTEHILRGGNRIGTYYIETGASLRPSQVVYDREHSAFAQLKPDKLDWQEVLQGKQFLVSTGITPALSPGCAQATFEAIETAHALGVKVCFDFNYRSKLWSKEAARQALKKYLPYIDILFANAGAAYDILEIDTNAYCKENNASEEEGMAFLAKELQKVGNFEVIALTMRQRMSASENGWSAMLFAGEESFQSRSYHLHIVDRLGGGDAFAAGILHGLAKGWDKQQTIDFATAASALKHTIPGDLNLVSEQEVLDVMAGDVSGSIKR